VRKKEKTENYFEYQKFKSFFRYILEGGAG
jgi:hypothetical protein